MPLESASPLAIEARTDDNKQPNIVRPVASLRLAFEFIGAKFSAFIQVPPNSPSR